MVSNDDREPENRDSLQQLEDGDGDGDQAQEQQQETHSQGCVIIISNLSGAVFLASNVLTHALTQNQKTGQSSWQLIRFCWPTQY